MSLAWLVDMPSLCVAALCQRWQPSGSCAEQEGFAIPLREMRDEGGPGMQMTDLPDGTEGLSWIVSRDPTQLLLIPGLQPASIAAAAAGDQQALAYLRFTAQQFAEYAGLHILSPLDRACLSASEVGDEQCQAYFLEDLQEKDLQLASIFEARLKHTNNQLECAARSGKLSALKWMKAICHFLFPSESIILRITAEAGSTGRLEISAIRAQPPGLGYICAQGKQDVIWTA